MKMLLVPALASGLASLALGISAEPRQAAAPAPFTEHDRAEIELLSARYSLALGSCDVKTWPELFVAADGYFAAGPRGKVQGRHRLGEMIRSYNCNYVDGVAPGHAPGVLVPYKIEIKPSLDGATGTAFYNGGHYEDVYVKTPQGWQFRSRTVVTNKEQAAGLNAADFDVIQQLAAAHGGPYRDVYEPALGGTRFKSAAVAIDVRSEGITGKAYLPNDGGHYEDVYVNTSAGWRFKSRIYVSADQEAAVGGRSAPMTLTAQDYFDIQQLVAKYARAIDTCSNNGYDYADLFTPDGSFAASRNGQIGARWEGRDKLAEASGGGVRGCKNVGWIDQGVRHLYPNHVITATADGAIGIVDMLMIGLGGDPHKIQYEGHYEDVYSKTPQGWRFKSRVHVNPVTVGRSSSTSGEQESASSQHTR